MRIGGFCRSIRGRAVWVAIEVNVALWGMIFCAMQAVQQLS